MWSGVRDELEGVTRENEAPSEAGPANEPWQEQHWSERLPQSPEKGAPGEWEEQWDDSAQGDVLVQPEDGRGVLGRPDAAAFVGDAGALVRSLMCLFVRAVRVADSSSAGMGRALRLALA